MNRRGHWRAVHCRSLPRHHWLRPLTVAALLLALAPGWASARLSNYPFRVVSEELADGQRLLAVNDGYAPVSLKLTISGDNLGIEPTGLVRIVVPPRTKLPLLRAFPFDPRRPYRVEKAISYQVGDERLQPDRAPLRLPFVEGQSAVVAAPAEGRRLGARFLLPAGEAVVAVRSGRVIDIDDSAVVVLHGDGSYARYGEIAPDAALQPGVPVVAGTMMGTAGGPEQPFELALQGTTAETQGPAAVPVPLLFHAYVPAQTLHLQPGASVLADYSNPYVPPPEPPPPPVPEPTVVTVLPPGAIDRDTVQRAFVAQHGYVPAKPAPAPSVVRVKLAAVQQAIGNALRNGLSFLQNPPQLNVAGAVLVVLSALLLAGALLKTLFSRSRHPLA